MARAMIHKRGREHASSLLRLRGTTKIVERWVETNRRPSANQLLRTPVFVPLFKGYAPPTVRRCAKACICNWLADASSGDINGLL